MKQLQSFHSSWSWRSSASHPRNSRRPSVGHGLTLAPRWAVDRSVHLTNNPPSSRPQAQCNNGRQQFPSWGRKKRSVLSSTGDRSSAGAAEDAESMTLSQEILVLDLGDDAARTAEKPAARQPAADAWPQDRRRLNPAASSCESPAGGISFIRSAGGNVNQLPLRCALAILQTPNGK